MNRPRWARLGAAVTLVATLGACTAGPTTEPEARPDRYVEPPRISAAAEARFGKEPAERAYREIADFVMDQWVTERLVDPQRTEPPTDAELSAGIVEQMTPTTQIHWHDTVAKALAGDANALEDVRVMRYFGIDAPTLTLPAGGPVTESQAVTNGLVDVGAPRADGLVPLRVAVHQRARIPLLNVRQPHPVQLDKDLNVEVVPAEQVNRLATASPTPVTPPTGTAPGPRITIDPDAEWLISTYDGELLVQFVEAGSASAPGTGDT